LVGCVTRVFGFLAAGRQARVATRLFTKETRVGVFCGIVKRAIG
jgi:hypothetical protein